MAKFKELDYNKIYYNPKGKAFKIIEELEPIRDAKGRLRRKVKVRFESGYETEVCLSNLYNKPVLLTDNLSPTVYGVGCLGYASYVGNEKMYDIWSGILYRCYCEDSDHYSSYGDKGVTICERWKRFDYFLEDVVNLPGYQEMIDHPDDKYQLDKDALQQGVPANQKVYSPETCMWILAHTNTIQRIIDNKDKYMSKYYGVQPSHGGNGHVARIKVNNKDEPIGSYDSDFYAAIAYNYAAIELGRPALNDVPFISKQELAKHLLRPRQMLVDGNRIYGVRQLPSGNYQMTISCNRDKLRLTFTNFIAAANVYNHYAQISGNPNMNNVPFMPIEECMKYLVSPRQMCTIVR